MNLVGCSHRGWRAGRSALLTGYAVLLGAGSGCSSEGEAGGSVEALCAERCDKIAQLACPPASGASGCQGDCEREYDEVPSKCRSAHVALGRCELGEYSWRCEDGRVAITATEACGDELSDVEACR